jgi:hypothetical protein
MASLLNRRNTPYIVVNNHSQVSYSTRHSNHEQLNKTENGIQTIDDTPSKKPHIATRSLYRFTRAIQV